MSVKTYSAKPGEIERRWYIVDAEGQILGRMAARIATVLRGKHKPVFTPHVDTGDFVVVVNAAKVRLTGEKGAKKLYRRHSGFPGGLTSIPYDKLLATKPERAIEKAVWGMLPKGRLGRRMIRKLKVYAGPEHPHGAQKPEPLGGVREGGSSSERGEGASRARPPQPTGPSDVDADTRAEAQER
jgi:large subunit ribosomal protein L13